MSKKKAASFQHLGAVDIGYGDVKFCFFQGGTMQAKKFPTGVQRIIDPDRTLGTDEFDYLKSKFIVGDRALDNPLPTTTKQFIHKYTPLLTFAALRDLPFIQKIAVGLPLRWYEEDKEALRKDLTQFMVNEKVNAYDVRVYPQGIGVLLDYFFNDEGEMKPDVGSNLLIVDIGYNTVDIVSVRNGQAIKRESQMREKWGIVYMLTELQKYLGKENRQRSLLELKEPLLTGKLIHNGQQEDISEITDEIKEAYVEMMMGFLNNDWSAKIERFTKDDRIIFAGGGAIYISQHFPKELENLVHVPEQPEFANVRGFLKGYMSDLKSEEE